MSVNLTNQQQGVIVAANIGDILNQGHRNMVPALNDAIEALLNAPDPQAVLDVWGPDGVAILQLCKQLGSLLNALAALGIDEGGMVEKLDDDVVRPEIIDGAKTGRLIYIGEALEN